MKTIATLSLVLWSAAAWAAGGDLNADSCCKNRTMLIGAVEMYKLDNKVKAFAVTPGSLGELVRKGYLQAIPSCVAYKAAPEHSYYSSGHPWSDVACRVHGTAACNPNILAEKPEVFGAVTIAPSDDVTAIREKLEQALATGRQMLAREQGADPSDVAEIEKRFAKVDSSLGANKLWDALGAMNWAYRDLARLEKDRVARSQESPLTAEEKAFLTKRATEPDDQVSYFRRVDLLARWIAELKAVGRPLDKFETLPARLRTAYLTRDKLKAAKVLDRIIQRLAVVGS
jgi:hypothetical protein